MHRLSRPGWGSFLKIVFRKIQKYLRKFFDTFFQYNPISVTCVNSNLNKAQKHADSAIGNNFCGYPNSSFAKAYLDSQFFCRMILDNNPKVLKSAVTTKALNV